MADAYDPLLARALGQIGDPDIINKLIGLPANELQALLLRVFQERTAQRTPKDILQAYSTNVYCGISGLDQLAHVDFTRKFLETSADRFTAVELSPVCPAGTNSVLARISQNNVLTGVRSLETVADPTTALALEAAKRRYATLRASKSAEADNEDIHLCTDHRLLRLQLFDKQLGYMQHFRCIGMVSAGRRRHRTLHHAQAVARHIQTYLDFIKHLQLSGYVLQDIQVLFSDVRIIEQLATVAGMSREVLMRHTQDPAFYPFRQFSIDLPEIVADPAHVPGDAEERYGLQHLVATLKDAHDMIVRPLQEVNTNVSFAFDLARVAGIGYYLDSCFHIFATNEQGLRLHLADGGFTDWTQRMLSDRGEYCFTSGFGSELINKTFRSQPS